MRTDPSRRVGVRRTLTTVLGIAALALSLAGTAQAAPTASAAGASAATISTVSVTPSIHPFGTASTARIVVQDRAHHRAVSGAALFSFDGKSWASRSLNAAGSASVAIPAGTTIGVHTIIVKYLPTAGSGGAASSGGKAFNVVKARAGWTVVGPGTPVYAGHTAINLTLRGTRVSPGTVTLSLNGRVIARQGVPASGFVGLRPAVSWSAGRQNFTLSYSGNAFNQPETRQLAVTTAKGSSAMALAAPATLGYLVGGTAQVSVSGVGATPTGTVTLLVDGRASSAAGLSDGSATLAVPALAGGSHVLTTTYSGDGNHQGTSRSTTVIAASNQCPVAARACVDLTHSVTWLQSGGRVTYGPVAMKPGRAGYRTNDGMFSVYYKDLHHYSSTFGGAPMPYSVFFDGGIAFHEGSLSIQSHGCIHLSQAAAQTYFATLQNGDQVYVFGSAPY